MAQLEEWLQSDAGAFTAAIYNFPGVIIDGVSHKIGSQNKQMEAGVVPREPRVTNYDQSGLNKGKHETRSEATMN